MRLFGLALVAVALVGCSSTAGAEEPTPAGRTFVSVGVTGEQIPGGGPLTLEFVDGRVSAFAGCNRGSGVADLTGGHLRTGDLATTMMACPPPFGEADAWMTRLLQSGPAWTLDGDDLTLTSDAVTVTLRDEKVLEPDRPLIDTDWRVDSLITRDSVMTSVALEQAEPRLMIRADQSAVGWTGCNTFYGRAEVTGQTVRFGPITTGGPACPGWIGEVEQAVLRALTGEATAIVDSDRLTLTNANGDGLTLRAE